MKAITHLRELTAPVDARRERMWLLSALLCDLLLVGIQTALAVTFTGPQLSDARSYLDLAAYCAQNKTWYPSANDMFAPYIFGNGYVNLLAACMRMAPGMFWVPLLNILFTQVIVLCAADIAQQLSGSRRTACLTMILLCLMGGLWGEVVSARTELCFMAFAFLSLSLLLRGGYAALLLSGVTLALANWVRPLVVIFLPAALFALLYRRVSVKKMAVYAAGMAVVMALIGAGAQERTGRFVFQAQTMGVNMLMGACDDADGSYLSTLYDEDGAGYLDPAVYQGVTFEQRDAIYKERAVGWILEHIPQFMLLVPAKLFYFLATDTYGGSAFFNHEIQTDNLAYLLDLKDILLGQGDRPLAAGDAVVIFSQLMYMLVFVLYLINIVHSIVGCYVLDLAPLHIIFVLACGVTVLTVGGARYHLPYLPIFCICAGIQLDAWLSRKRRAA